MNRRVICMRRTEVARCSCGVRRSKFENCWVFAQFGAKEFAKIARIDGALLKRALLLMGLHKSCADDHVVVEMLLCLDELTLELNRKELRS